MGRKADRDPLRSAGRAGIQNRNAALPYFGGATAGVVAQVGPQAGSLPLLLFPRLIATPLLGGGLLLALHGFTPGLLALVCLAAGLRLALDALLVQHLRIAIGGAARLFHPLGMRLALQPLVTLGLCCAPQLLAAPGLAP